MTTPLERQAERVPGFLNAAEGRRLYEAAREVSAMGPCLEIGSYCGKSAVYLGAGCRETGGALFSVDHHRGSEEQQPGEAYFDPALFNPRIFAVDTLPAFRSTIAAAGLEDTVVPLVCPSGVAARAWSAGLSLVFIDGGHAYETVWADYEGWSRHLLPGGYLLMHDIFPDPARGGQAPYRVYCQALAGGLFEALPTVETLGVLRRCR